MSQGSRKIFFFSSQATKITAVIIFLGIKKKLGQISPSSSWLVLTFTQEKQGQTVHIAKHRKTQTDRKANRLTDE